MKSISEKVSYIDGLMEGLGFKNDSKEEKVLSKIVSVLKDISEEIEDLRAAQEENEEYIDVIDSDLNDLEKEIYEDEDYEDEEGLEDNLEDYIHLQCSNCNDTINIDKDILENNTEINCPNCHKTISLNDKEDKEEK
jgi:DNA-directed RNA polymerase subunit RPC12/RpoP